MTRAEREKLIEEKNLVLGQKNDTQIGNKFTKRKLFTNKNANGEDKNEENESNLTEADRALLKVLNLLIYYSLT